MLRKPGSLSGVGAVQFFLALAFVIWLLFFPDTGGKFAWPVVPRLTAMFIGVSFILRTFIGYHLWREQYWHRLHWYQWGGYTFLGVILLATFWHIGELNWKSNILVAHLWLVAYIIEPLTLVLIEPHGEQGRQVLSHQYSEGPLMPGLKRTLVAVYIVGFTIGGILLINPKFADTRWPWPLDPFDARIMAAWPFGCSVWAATMYFYKDWAEVKMGVRLLAIYATSLFLLWAFTFSQYDPARPNRLTVGVVTGVVALLLIYYYWRQEAARRKLVESGDLEESAPALTQ